MVDVLLIEDDAFISDIIETKLCQAGIEVETTADGAHVTDKLLETTPSLVLLDLMLPNRHGFEILEEMRNRVAFKDLPVIVLSNENGPDVEAKATQLDAQYFFKAMTDMNELVKSVQKILNAG